jgi:hypothetical protein
LRLPRLPSPESMTSGKTTFMDNKISISQKILYAFLARGILAGRLFLNSQALA